MSRKVTVVLAALLAVLLVANWHIFGTSAGARLADWILIGVILNRAYYKYRKSDRALMPASKGPLKKPSLQVPLRSSEIPGSLTLPGSQDTAGQITVVSIVIILIFLFAAYRLVGAAARNFFVWGDHILGSGHSPWPLVKWAAAGIPFGAVVGSIVIWKKYRIKFKWCLAPLIPFFLVVFCLHSLSGPFKAFELPTLTAVADSVKEIPGNNEMPVTVKEAKMSSKKSTKSRNVSRHVEMPLNSCIKDQAVVTINARSDSVEIHYRTASYQNGPWGAWKSKFIPQQGQFSLTDGGPVSANSLQYYFEIKSVLTRSAQNPYSRQLCEGQLVIDTY